MIPAELVAASQAGPLDAALAPPYWLLTLWSDLLFAVGDATGPGFLDYRFMHRAILVGLCTGMTAPLIGTFLVHRQLALIGDALVHTAFAGVVVGPFLDDVFSLGVSLYLTAVVIAVIAALLIEFISEATDAYNDVSMAVVFSTGFALGIVLISLNAGGLAVGINQYLFGSLLTVPAENTAILFVLPAVIVGTVALTCSQLFYVTSDEMAAAVSSISVTWYNRVVVMPTTLVVVGVMQIMGVIFAAAMLVVPVAGMTQVSRSLSESLLVSVVLAELAVLLSIGASYHGEATAGGVIVLVAIGIYVVAVATGKVQARAGADTTPELGSIDSREAQPWDSIAPFPVCAW